MNSCRTLIVSIAFIAILTHPISSQTSAAYSVGDLTNRPLGYANDATAAVWNPALLALADNWELFFGVPTISKPTFRSNGSLSTFLKLSGLSIGLVVRNSELKLSSQFVSSYGSRLFDDCWLGGGVLIQNIEGNANGSVADRSTRYNSSILVHPWRPLLVSIGASSMHFGSKDELLWTIQSTYSPTDWVTAHLNMSYSKDSLFAVGNTSTQFGVSSNFLGDWLVVSAMYNIEQNVLRVGTELTITPWGIGVGHLASPSFSADPYSGFTFFRYTEDTRMATSSFINSSGSNMTDGDICNPDVATWSLGLVPAGASDLYSFVASHKGEYVEIAEMMRETTLDINNLYSAIAERYYPNSIVKPKELQGLAVDVVRPTERGSNLITERVDTLSPAKLVVTCAVRDKYGRNIGTLNRSSFVSTSDEFEVVNASQTTSTTVSPVDVVFIMDCSGSMAEEISAVRSNVESFVRSVESRGMDCRVGCVLTGRKVLESLSPTDDIGAFKFVFGKAEADKDGENTSDGIMEAADMDFRSTAQKLIVAVTDECMFQTNSSETELTVLKELWKKGISLYSVVNSSDYNGGVVTRLSLGRDYNIYENLSTILDNISNDISTTYEVTLEKKKPKPVQVVAKILPVIVRGKVLDEQGFALGGATMEFRSPPTEKIKTISNKINGSYEIEIKPSTEYRADILRDDFVQLRDQLVVVAQKAGDTVERNFIMKKLVTTLSGKVTDENGVARIGLVKIENAQTFQLVATIRTDGHGYYQTDITAGNTYRLTPSVPEFVPITSELDLTKTKKGESVRQDLVVNSVDFAIENGLTFKLKNVFFASGKWETQPTSDPELRRLVEFLTEYKMLRVEISAHTDNVGKDDANMTLSNNRAKAVKDYLNALGIAESRLTSKGYGKSKPISDNATEEGRAQNRRVEFKLIR